MNTVKRLNIVVRQRIPFTSGVIALIVLLALLTGSAWSAAQEQSWFAEIGYGLAPLLAGAWWTPITGALFGLNPTMYIPILISFLLLVGYTEIKLGTRKVAVLCLIGQVGATAVSALLLLVLRDSGWSWAAVTATSVDVGFSAGALACAAVVSAQLVSPWRIRFRAALVMYVVISFLFLGSLADLEHLVAVVGGLLAGPAVVGRRVRTGSPSRREWRLLAVAGVVLLGLGEVVLRFAPAGGPLGVPADVTDPGWGVWINLLVIVLLVQGLRRGRQVAWWATVALAILNIVAGAIGIAMGAMGVQPEEWALAIAGVVLWLALLLVLIAARSAFRSPTGRLVRTRGLLGATDRSTARDLLMRNGGGNMSWMTTWADNSYFLTPDAQSVVAFQRHAGVAISVADPVSTPENLSSAVRQFAARSEQSGLIPALFSVGEETAAVTDALGWRRVQVAEDTVIDLATLEFRGKSWQDVRSALNRAEKEGIGYRHVRLAQQPWAIRAQVQAISEEWVGDKGMPEMGFTLGGVDQMLDPDVRVGLAVDVDGSVHGVTSWLPVFGPGGAVVGWTLDVMRRRRDGFRPVIEFLIANACLTFRAEGARTVSLSGAPLARSDSHVADGSVEQMLDTLGATLEPVYGFKSLHAFKNKFSPRYVPMYLTYRDEADLPRIGIALTKAYLPSAGLRDLVAMAGRH